VDEEVGDEDVEDDEPLRAAVVGEIIILGIESVTGASAIEVEDVAEELENNADEDEDGPLMDWDEELVEDTLLSGGEDVLALLGGLAISFCK